MVSECGIKNNNKKVVGVLYFDLSLFFLPTVFVPLALGVVFIIYGLFVKMRLLFNLICFSSILTP